MHMNPFNSLRECREGNLENVLTAHIIVSSVGGQASNRVQPTEPTNLAAKWRIGLEAACRALECTTQKGLWTVLHPSLSRRLLINDRKLQYRLLQHDIFGDTLLAGTKSKCGNKFSEEFSQILDGRVCFPWLRRGVHMRFYPCCFKGMEYLPR